jgi:hypothetical protein
MNPEQLLIKRFECIGTDDAHYPGSPFNVGDILEMSGDCAGNQRTQSGVFENSVYMPEWYPLLFKPLKWYQKREPADLPLFVKIKKQVLQVNYWELNKEGQALMWLKEEWGGSLDWYPDEFMPATREEFDKYVKTKEK